ncbi:MAG: SNF2-related protein [Desulfatiglandaceae bacterium]
MHITRKLIKDRVADSPAIYQRGIGLYENGSFFLKESDPEQGYFTYHVDGNYGDYQTEIRIHNGDLTYACTCPYPGEGCKHTVAALLHARDVLDRWNTPVETPKAGEDPDTEKYLTGDEIRAQAIEDRKKRAQSENFTVHEGDTYKGEHLLETALGKQYTVTLHDPVQGKGHCSCPDYAVNRMGICKHLIYMKNHLKRKKDLKKRMLKERFPFVDIYWDSVSDQPGLYYQKPLPKITGLKTNLSEFFTEQGHFMDRPLQDLLGLIKNVDGFKQVRIQPLIFTKLEKALQDEEIKQMTRSTHIPELNLRASLYPYQEEGVKFSLFKPAALIGDEMGLGKTLQAIALAILKQEVFDFKKVLVVTLASLKEQWKREIERFSEQEAVIVEGPPQKRQGIYEGNGGYFKITNYEAVLRDTMVLSRFKPDLIILDEAQRIKNFSTKTADAVKSIPRKHAVVLTGTPLENKLEDVYSIVQFLDPELLTPLWQFAADHFMLSRNKRGKILGYRNLDKLHDRLSPLVIRRKKEEVLKDLPREVENNYYLDLHHKQQKIHNGYMQSLLPLINKKYLTPMDLRRIQELLLRMRMVCNSTYLIDRKTHLSPKLNELEGILDELVVQNRRKMVIFSEWTTMTYLIARHLSDAGIHFVELSGKVPVKKRQALIDEFTHNADCRVFLSTDAGGTGLNLQAADCVVNFELPWNPARMRQRIGRVNRIGQKSGCVNVINLIAKNSIEEKILAGLQLKTDLFKGVFDGGLDQVEFTHEKRVELLNRLREMMDDELLIPSPEKADSEEIPEDAPYYLNPEVLQREEEAAVIDVGAEETGAPAGGESDMDTARPQAEASAAGETQTAQTAESPEKLENVLNQGMAFIGGLMEMATGKQMKPASKDGRMLHVDKDTGEVTMKFKLPGF